MGEYISLNIELTDYCNLKCMMCDQSISNGLPHGSARGYMTRKTWISILDSLEGFDDEVHISAFWLGEPLLHPDFGELMRLAFRRNKGNRLFRDIKIHTNGILLKGDKLEAVLDCAGQDNVLDDTFSFVHCSVEAVNPGTYKAIKGADSLDLVRGNLVTFLDERMKRGLSFPKLTVAFIVMEENHHEAGEFLEEWSKVFESRELEYQVTSDWPPKLLDTIYFRRLSTSDQERADDLHRQVVEMLGISAARIEESF